MARYTGVYNRETSWAYTVELPGGPNGKRRQQQVSGFPTEKAAKEARAKRVAEIENGTDLESGKATLNEFLERWLGHKKPGVAWNTFLSYECLVRLRIAPTLGPLRLSKLSPLTLQTWVSSDEGSGAQGVLAFRVLKQALAQAVRWQLLSRNPCDHVDGPRSPERDEDEPPNVLTGDELARLLEEADPLLRVAIVIAAGTAMREGEIAGLRWDMLDLGAGTLEVRQQFARSEDGHSFGRTKTKKRRQIALPEAVVSVLRKHRGHQAERRLLYGPEYQDNGLVLAQRDGRPLTPELISMRFRRLRERLSISVTFHGLRHAHATDLLAAGVAAKIVSERLGHSRVAITLDTYSHVLPRMQDEAARVADAALRRALDRKAAG